MRLAIILVVILLAAWLYLATIGLLRSSRSMQQRLIVSVLTVRS
jgi:hypothetical protein